MMACPGHSAIWHNPACDLRAVAALILNQIRRAPVTQVFDRLICLTDSIRRINEASGGFRVLFSEHPSWYRTNEPALQRSLRAAHDANCEVSFSCKPDCEIVSVTVHPPRSFARRLAGDLYEICESVFDAVTRRNTRWIRDAKRAAPDRRKDASQ
jgi:hypothetical protein